MSDLNGLKLRARNVLTQLGIKNKKQAILAYKKNNNVFLYAPNCGNKTAFEIMEWATFSEDENKREEPDMRDEFAGKAMQSMFVCITDNGRFLDDTILNEIAEKSYKMANAMMEAREK